MTKQHRSIKQIQLLVYGMEHGVETITNELNRRLSDLQDDPAVRVDHVYTKPVIDGATGLYFITIHYRRAEKAVASKTVHDEMDQSNPYYFDVSRKTVEQNIEFLQDEFDPTSLIEDRWTIWDNSKGDIIFKAFSESHARLLVQLLTENASRVKNISFEKNEAVTE